MIKLVIPSKINLFLVRFSLFPISHKANKQIYLFGRAPISSFPWDFKAWFLAILSINTLFLEDDKIKEATALALDTITSWVEEFKMLLMVYSMSNNPN